MSIGKPVANTQMYILDPKHRLCPRGAVGYVQDAAVVQIRRQIDLVASVTSGDVD